MTERQIVILLIILRDVLTEMRDLSSSLGVMSSYRKFDSEIDILRAEFSEYFKE